ncbi:MAG: hypothetical protein RQ731_09770 [Anaerosomatales bacterium]|nr:hypothetical protein [Anaerosomatales bacterium]
MTGQPQAPENEASKLEQTYSAKAHAELAAADRLAPGIDGVPWSGDVFAEVVLVKGEPGPAEVSGGPALSGPDGVAMRKALEALGFDPASVFATVARPEAGIDASLLRERLRMQIEAVDPTVVVALDAMAATEVAAVFDLGQPAYGTAVHANGRAFVALEGLESSLADARLKRRVWRQMQAIQVRPPAL